ncbi:hypothetical protein EDEG_00149 [Edhazardia aedis USNM 41457]|uniref:Uncharacterized protein n=1 Tax=Edhazardia aedis (strain USNM 41457) TaxID=1003232 RepID=J8ZX28_EDHAE|nr:hypothetical protein EDEG_00149 [Edhazardia aedis USNM 41457]|eukprot:EJW04233.1 hypothetical protein EDEG_00149 [Edhazardia aedis USNM 41457]
MKLSVNDCNKLIKDLTKLQTQCKKKNPQLNDMSMLCINKLQALKDSSGADILRGDFLYILVPFLYAIEGNLFGKGGIVLLEDVHVILQSFLLSLNGDEFKNKEFFLNGLFDDCMVYDLSDVCSVTNSIDDNKEKNSINNIGENISASVGDNNNNNADVDNNSSNDNISTKELSMDDITLCKRKKEGKSLVKKYVGIFNKHPLCIPDEQQNNYELSTPSDILKFLIDTYLTILNTQTESDILIKVLQTLSSIIPLLYGKYLFKIFYNVVSIFDNNDRRLYSVMQAVVLQIVCGVFDRFEKLYKYFSFKDISSGENLFVDNAKIEHVPKFSKTGIVYANVNCVVGKINEAEKDHSEDNADYKTDINDKIDNILENEEIIIESNNFQNDDDSVRNFLIDSGVYVTQNETEGEEECVNVASCDNTSFSRELLLEQSSIKESDKLNEESNNNKLIKRIRTVSIDCTRMLKDIYKLLCQPISSEFSFITMISLDMLSYALKNREIFKNNHSREVLHKIPEQLYNIKRYVGREYMYLNYDNFSIKDDGDEEEQKDEVIDLDNSSYLSATVENSKSHNVLNSFNSLKGTMLNNYNDLCTLKFLQNRNIPLVFTISQSSYQKEHEFFRVESFNIEKDLISEKINKIFIKLIKEYDEFLHFELLEILKKEVSILADPKFIGHFDENVIKTLNNEDLHNILFVSICKFFSYENISATNKRNFLKSAFFYVKENKIDASSIFFEFFVVLFIDAFKLKIIQSDDNFSPECANNTSSKDFFCGIIPKCNNENEKINHRNDNELYVVCEKENSNETTSEPKNLFILIVNYLIPILMQKNDLKLLQVIIKDSCISEIIKIVISYKEFVTREWMVIFDEILDDNYYESTKSSHKHDKLDCENSDSNINVLMNVENPTHLFGCMISDSKNSSDNITNMNTKNSNIDDRNTKLLNDNNDSLDKNRIDNENNIQTAIEDESTRKNQ